ncbi:MAG: nucleotidyltransferase domain-containing protein [Cyclobacteriaceae bacterium]
MIEKIKNISKKFLVRYFHNCHSAWLTGSFTTGNFTDESDIDLIILSKVIDKQFIENFFFENYNIQTIVLPYHRIHELIQKDYDRREGIYINMIQNAVLIKGDPIFFDSIKSIANFLASKGPKTHSELLFKKTRYHITSRIHDLEGSENFNESLFVALEIVQEVTRLNLMFSQQWSGSKGKHLAKFLSKTDPAFYNELCDSFQSFVNEKDSKNLVKVVSNNLKRFGGHLNHLSTHEVLTEVKEDQAVVQVRYTDMPDLKFVLTEFISPLVDLINKPPASEIYVYKTDENPYSDPAIYIIINASRDWINDNLLSMIQQFSLNNRQRINMNGLKFVFPAEYYPYLGFGHTNTFEISDSLFTDLTFKLQKEGYSSLDNENHLSQSILLILSFGVSLKISLDKFFKLTCYLYEMLLPRAYDQLGSLNAEQLVYKKEEVVNEFQEHYASQKAGLSSLFINIIEQWESDDYHIDDRGFLDIFLKYDFNQDFDADELFIPRFNTDNSLSQSEQKLFSYYAMLVNRMFDCCFVDDNNKAYTLFAIKEMLVGANLAIGENVTEF